MLQMNGWIPLDVQDKKDRTAAKAQMKALLEKKAIYSCFLRERKMSVLICC